MRKCLSQFAVLLAALVVATSSVSAAERPSFGALGGLHMANLTVNPDPTDATLDSIRKANIGGLVEFDLGPKVSLAATERCISLISDPSRNGPISPQGPRW